MSPLDYKLMRDLKRMKGQVAAIGIVIAIGVMLQVMMSGIVTSLSETRDTYYDRYRLADIFAPATRAPNYLLRELSEIDGVTAVEGRISGSAMIDVASQSLPVQAQVLSLPDLTSPRVNDILVTDGQMLSGGTDDEIVLLDGFAKAHGLVPGDTLSATINGAKREYVIVGLAQSPEFLYTTAPGELIPDDARFGVIWMGYSPLAAAFDLNGSFNEALLTLGRHANLHEVIDKVDLVLGEHGGLGAYGVEDQFSNRFVSEEISGMVVSSTAVPPIFLAVAAFLLYIVISRMVQSEREEIGLMKAFGYTDFEVSIHYFKLVLFIAVSGALFGCLLGIITGRAMIPMYTLYFKFPFLVFRVDLSSFIIGFGASVFSASLGGLFVLRRIFALRPAEAMRPPAPPDFTQAGRIGRGLARHLDQPSRMVLRRITRQPVRMLVAVLGIASGMAITAAMTTIYVGFEETLDLSFSTVDRSDARISFYGPIGQKAAFELYQIEGVLLVEPVRDVPVVFRNGTKTHKGAITGLQNGATLSRAIDSNYRAISLPDNGLVLTPGLAGVLDVRPGDYLTVEVRTAHQPELRLPVSNIAESLLGSPAYMELEALNRALGQRARMTGAYLKLDEDRQSNVYDRVKTMPTVAGISLKNDAKEAFQEIMNTGAGSVRYVMGVVAFVITFGIVYNAARVAHAERARDLGSLRVIGFHTGETAFVLLGELAVVVLIALPLGSVMGYYLGFGIAQGFSTDLYQIPADFHPMSYGFAALVVIFAALVSGWVVKRDLDRADLIETLKTRE